jgi:hypothetical protein
MAERALATAFVNLVPGTVELDKYIKKDLGIAVEEAGTSAGQKLGTKVGEGFGSKIKSHIMPVLGSLGVAFGAAGVINFGKDMYQAAVEGAKGDAVLGNITKSMGLFGDKTDKVTGRVMDYATAMMKSTGVDDDTIKAAQAKLMTFSKVAKSADTMGGTFDKTTSLAADLAAAGFGTMDSAAVMLGKALQDPEKGVTALQRVGVSLSESQKNQVKDFMKVNDVAGAQKVILDEVSKQVGGTAEASATASEKMSARWDDAVQNLGTTLMPVFDAVIGFIGDKLVPAFDDASAGVTKFFGWFNDNQSWLLPVLAGISGILLSIGIYLGIMNVMALITAAGGLPAIIAATWAWTAALLANPITWIILGIGLLIAGIVALAMNWDKVVKWISTVWGGFTKWLGTAFKAMGKWWNDTWSAMGNFIKDTFNAIVGFVKAPINFIIDLINSMIDRINAVKIDIPAFARGLFGGAKTLGFDINHIPHLAKGGLVTGPTTALIGEAGPEVVTPLKDFERMAGIGSGKGQTIIYNAAPNDSIDAEQKLVNAVQRARVLGWT